MISKNNKTFLIYCVIESLNLKDTKNMEQLKVLQRKVPVLAEAILTATLHDGTIRKEICEIIPHIIRLVNLPYKKYRIPDKKVYQKPSGEKFELFPCFQRIRVRPLYDADKQGKASEEEFCRKETHSHNSLTPGLFTIFCEHQVCLGFSLMQQVESPRTPFDILLERFPQEILDNLTMVYDNCCKFQNYALRREPKRFSRTKCFVDRLHYRSNHVGCSNGYSLDIYKSNTRLNKLNSQMNEQANADLRRLSTQVTYMTPHNVIQHVAIFLALRNMKKKALCI